LSLESCRPLSPLPAALPTYHPSIPHRITPLLSVCWQHARNSPATEVTGPPPHAMREWGPETKVGGMGCPAHCPALRHWLGPSTSQGLNPLAPLAKTLRTLGQCASGRDHPFALCIPENAPSVLATSAPASARPSLPSDLETTAGAPTQGCHGGLRRRRLYSMDSRTLVRNSCVSVMHHGCTRSQPRPLPP
jgi:hypothetical protein